MMIHFKNIRFNIDAGTDNTVLRRRLQITAGKKRYPASCEPRYQGIVIDVVRIIYTIVVRTAPQNLSSRISYSEFWSFLQPYDLCSTRLCRVDRLIHEISVKIHVIRFSVLHVPVNREIKRTDPESINDLRHIIVMIVMVMWQIHVKAGLIVILEPIDHGPVRVFVARIHEETSSAWHQICGVAIGSIPCIDRIYLHIRRGGIYFPHVNRQDEADQHSRDHESCDFFFHFFARIPIICLKFCISCFLKHQ